jgi:hypothetical protein
MPIALGGLICAVRAARSRSPWLWDLLGLLAVVLALGIKNTFCAVVPVQAFLRVAASEGPWVVRLQRNWFRAALVLATLAAPIAHYIVFRGTWHPGQYRVGFTWEQIPRFGRALAGAVSYDWMGPGLLAALLAWWLHRSTADGKALPREYRLACGAGLLLLLLGVGVYLPMGTASGRYTMPAVWGADLMIAVLLSATAAAPPVWKRGVAVALGLGLLGVVIGNVGKQERYAARLEMLWQTVAELEEQAPAGASIAWVGAVWPAIGPEDLGDQEGSNLAAHLRGRGRSDLQFQFIKAGGADAQPNPESPMLLVTGSRASVAAGWRLLREVNVPYWFGLCHYRSFLWGRVSEGKPSEERS